MAKKGFELELPSLGLLSDGDSRRDCPLDLHVVRAYCGREKESECLRV